MRNSERPAYASIVSSTSPIPRGLNRASIGLTISRMAVIAPVRPSLLHTAFLEAFADYAMDASSATEEQLLLRMRKNCVAYDISPGLYDGDRLVGFTLIGIDEWGGCRTAFDAGTGIVAAFRKQGWAKRMFDHALPMLRARGVEQFVLEALKGNEPAIRAYRRSGFEISREFRCFTASTQTVRERPAGPLPIHVVSSDTVDDLQEATDWLPSFENRFTAPAAVPEQVISHGAFAADRCIGIATYLPILNWLLTLLVHPDVRRRGIGRSLLQRVATQIPDTICNLSVLNVDASDTGMQGFLQQCGFGHLVDQVEMRRTI